MCFSLQLARLMKVQSPCVMNARIFEAEVSHWEAFKPSYVEAIRHCQSIRFDEFVNRGSIKASETQ